MISTRLSVLALFVPVLLAGCASNKTTMTLSFTDLLELGESYQCAFEDDTSEGRSSGTVYVEGGGKRVYGEFVMRQPDGQMNDTYLIHADQKSYIWTTEEEQGVMITLEDDDTLFGDTNTDGIGVDEDDEMDFECQPWTVDASKFTPPADREFIDMNAMLQGMQQQLQDAGGNTEAMKAAQCAACDRAPDAESQAQCRRALQC